MSNYPPGVSGLEYEISGPDWDRDETRECPTCESEQLGLTQGYRREVWWICDRCATVVDIDPYDPYEDDRY